MMSFLPGGSCNDTIMIISTMLISTCLQIIVSSIFLLFVYKLVLTIKRRRSCHGYKSTTAPECGRYHLDLLIPYPNTPLIVKIVNLSYPLHFYKPITESYTITVKTLSKCCEIDFCKLVTLETVWNKTIPLITPIVVTDDLPEYQGPGYLIFENQ